MTEERCIADGCRKPAEPNRKYCSGHRKREKQQKPIEATPLRGWGANPGAYLEAKALEYAEAEGERETGLARKRLRYAAVRYAQRQKVPKSPQN